MKKFTKTCFPLLTLVGLTPLSVMGADMIDIVSASQDIVNVLIPLFMTIAVAVFLWGVVKFIASAGNPEKMKSAKGYIIHALD